MKVKGGPVLGRNTRSREEEGEDDGVNMTEVHYMHA
jgi:hypothetical protein